MKLTHDDLNDIRNALRCYIDDLGRYRGRSYYTTTVPVIERLAILDQRILAEMEELSAKSNLSIP